MTADMSSSYSEAPPARHSGTTRTVVAVLGIATVLVGGVLLVNPFAAARTLALLIGLALVIGGCLEISVAWDSGRRVTGILLGGVLVLGGLLAMFWPGATVWTLAVVTGVSLLAHGIAEVLIALRSPAETPGRAWLALAGALNIVVGILALAWPETTVLVLSLALGVQILVFGVLLLVAAFSGSRSRV
jgi:uncharacterized membrane protein HdeD (DUF308 family)